jgi:hypothetical protein
MKKILICIIALTSLFGAEKTSAQVSVGVSIGVAPPEMPVYVQPPCPVVGYMWTPGYWAWGPNGYYWVPGVWVAPPSVGLLWTPGWWGWEGGHYFWHGGYWGPHIGFYGGVNYGFGYYGHGFYGGRWEGGAFRYNTSVWAVNNNVIHNTYVERPAEGPGASHAAFNGGPGGVTAAPSPAEESAMHENHVQPTSSQMSHEHSASMSHSQLASVNHGHPTTAARATVGGQRFNASGHAMVASHATHAGTQAHMNNNMGHANMAQHSAPQSRPAMQQHSAPAAHMNGGGMHAGGGHMGGGGGHHGGR